MNAKVMGVSGTHGCVQSRTQFVTWENSFAVVWNKDHIFESHTLITTWIYHEMPMKFSGNYLAFEKFCFYAT